MKGFAFKLGMQPDVFHSPNQAFEFASQNGLDHIEILMDHPYYHHESLSFAEILELKGSYDLDVLIHAPATATNFISISSEVRRASYEELKKTMAFAMRCEAELITFHLGWSPGFITSRGYIFKPEWYSEHNFRVITEEMLKFLKGIDSSFLSLENTIELDDRTRGAIERLIIETDLRLTLDTGHWNLRTTHDLFFKHFERVANIHLHDNKGDYDTHLPLGKGSFDLSLIPLASYGGYLTLELRDEEAIIESKEFLERYLKSC
jgi:sugar phosphate isomerase/epimerase